MTETSKSLNKDFQVANESDLNVTIKKSDSNNNNQITVNLNKNGSLNLKDLKNFYPLNKNDSFNINANNFKPIFPSESHNGLIIPKIVTTTAHATAKPNGSRIKRESLIHKNDVFQFDDVDSVHTSDIYFKNTPLSSFESSSDETWKSKSASPRKNNSSHNNNNSKKSNNPHTSKTQKHSNKLANFITPMFRSNSNSSNIANKSLRPKSIFLSVSTESNSAPKIKKSNTNNTISSNTGEVIKTKGNHSNLLTNSSSVTSLETGNVKNQKKSLIRHFNSFKKLIKNKSNLKSTPNLVVPEIVNTTSSILTTVSSSKQLTILVNNNNNTDSSHDAKELNNSEHNNINANDLISIPMSSNTTTSFTIKNSYPDEADDSNRHQINGIKIDDLKKTKSFLKSKMNKK